MTRKEAARLTHQENTLLGLGFTREEAEALRRISMTLRRWYERECGVGGGCIERDEAGRPFWHNSYSGRMTPIADRETGARKRLTYIVKARNARTEAAPWVACGGMLDAYIQTDPRGCTLYILRPGDVPAGGDPSAYYSRGIAVS